MANDERRPDSAEGQPAAREQGAAPAPDHEAGQDAGQQEHHTVTLPLAQYEELKTLAAERDDFLRRLQRAVADYQNLQKRVVQRQATEREAALRALVENILPVADSLMLALEAAEQTEGGAALLRGLQLVEQALYAALEKLDIRPMDVVGAPFDPHIHEAAFQQPVEGIPEGRVVRVLKRGFTLGGQVIRPSQVVVSGPPPGGAAARWAEQD